MQNLFTIIGCGSWNKLFFSCCLVCISMTWAFWCQYAVENKAGIPACDATGKFAQSQYTGVRRHREVCAKPVYRRATPQGSLRKAGIPACDVLRVKYYKNDIKLDDKNNHLYMGRVLVCLQVVVEVNCNRCRSYPMSIDCNSVLHVL